MTDVAGKPWYKKWWAITLFVFFGIAVLGNLSGKSNNPTVNGAKPMAPASEEQVVAVFDVAALYGENIDEVRTVLGTPQSVDLEPTQEQLQLGIKEWDSIFQKDGYDLLVTYDALSRGVIDFFIATDDPSGLTRDTKKLEKILNVQDSANFTIEPVKAWSDPSFYTGIKVIPKN